MKRETLRRIILTISAIIVPLLIIFSAPVLVRTPAADAIAVCTIFFAVLFISSVFIGRLWCGWICPCGGMQDIIGIGFKKKPKKSRLDAAKFIILFLWLGAIVYLSVNAGAIAGINPYYSPDDGIGGLISVMIYPALIVLIVIAGLSVITAIFGSRSFCRYFCPIGALLILGRNFGRMNALTQIDLIYDSKKCNDCGGCTQSCPMGINVSKTAKSNGTYYENCIICGTCCDKCEFGALKLGFRKGG